VMTIGTCARHRERVGLLLLLCAVIPCQGSAQPDADSSKTQRRSVREPDVMAQRLVSADQGLWILGAALESRHTDANADCSNLVHEIYVRAGFRYDYANSTDLYQGIKEFGQVTHPQPGDLVVWRGHVGIVISPVQHSFFSAMRSGRGVEFYDSPYWEERGRPRFFRYLKAATRSQLSASASRVRSGSTKAETRGQVQADENFTSTASVSRARQGSEDESVRRGGRGVANEVAPVVVSKANPPAMPSVVDEPQAGPLRNSEEHATRDAESAGNRNQVTPARHKVQNLEDGVWETPASKPSAGIPFDSVVPSAEPKARAPQEVVAANIPAVANHADARLRSAAKLPAHELKPEPTQWAMSRYVPRPPWSLPSGSTAGPRVPRPPAGRTQRIPGFYLPSGQVQY
jgi:hypothetical protein